MMVRRPTAVTLLVLAVLAVLTAALVAFAAPAAAGGYTTYWGDRSLSQLTVRKQVVVEPGPEGIFWATQIWFEGGDGGYFGMQANRAVDGGRREQKTFIFSLWGTPEARTSNPSAWCGQWRSAGEGGAGFGSTCRTLVDWVQGRTYRFDLRRTGSHWWTVAVVEEQTGRRFTVGSIRTPSGWGKLTSGIMAWDEEYAGNFPYAKVRTSVPTGDDGRVRLRQTQVEERPGAEVHCDQTWCTHEIGVERRPARVPAPRPVTVKPAGDLAAGRPAMASSSVPGPDARPAGLAVDSTRASAWEPADGGDQWWQVDLGTPARLSRVVLDWDHTDVPSAYQVKVSVDGRVWTTVARAGWPEGGVLEHRLAEVNARYVRIATQAGGRVALWDAQVFGLRAAATPSPSASPAPSAGGIAPVPTLESVPAPTHTRPSLADSDQGDAATLGTAWLLIAVGAVAVVVGVGQSALLTGLARMSRMAAETGLVAAVRARLLPRRGRHRRPD